MRFNGFIFDLDGTLIDSNGVWKKIDKYVLEKHKIFLSDKELDKAAAMNYDDVYEWMISLGIDCTLDELKDEFDRLAVREYRYNIFLKDGVRDYLETLKRVGGKIALATGSPKRLYEPVLRNNCIYGMFDVLVSTDEIGVEKDWPDIYFEAAKRLGLPIDRCAVFEDVLKCILTAKNAGFYTVAVYDKYSADNIVSIKNAADELIMSFNEPVLLTNKKYN